MKIGERVRVTRIPAGLKNHWLEGHRMARRCLGREFPVRGVQRVSKLHQNWLELWVGEVLGKEASQEKLWIEPECVEVVRPATRGRGRK